MKTASYSSLSNTMLSENIICNCARTIGVYGSEIWRNILNNRTATLLQMNTKWILECSSSERTDSCRTIAMLILRQLRFCGSWAPKNCRKIVSKIVTSLKKHSNRNIVHKGTLVIETVKMFLFSLVYGPPTKIYNVMLHTFFHSAKFSITKLAWREKQNTIFHNFFCKRNGADKCYKFGMTNPDIEWLG